jgi:uncharacterized membrane protein HdeD (DUF308 family)
VGRARQRVAWLVIALVILQFDRASVTTVGALVGIMFVLTRVQKFVLRARGRSVRWLWALFGVLFAAAGFVCFVKPADAFAGSRTSSASGSC